MKHGSRWCLSTSVVAVLSPARIESTSRMCVWGWMVKMVIGVAMPEVGQPGNSSTTSSTSMMPTQKIGAA